MNITNVTVTKVAEESTENAETTSWNIPSSMTR